ncbi:MAG: hypothetical protein KC549_06100 [Myxococcales bacterium]|nr:hypothetical protein [Myxococcales bacterium]
MKTRHPAMLIALITLAGCELLGDPEEGWGRQREGEFRGCTCQFEVEGVVERSESGALDIFEVEAGGRRKPYYGGDGSLVFECAAGPDESSRRGVTIVIDDFRGAGDYDLTAPDSIDPSTLSYRPSNLGGSSYRPAEGGDCVLEVGQGREGSFRCVDMRGTEGTLTLTGAFACDH